MGSSTFFSILPTFFATLSGVIIAFRLDRYAERKRARETTLEQLKTIKSELDENSDTLESNYRVINQLQEEGNSASHYALALCSTSAWEASLDKSVIEHIDPTLYRELQQVYSKTEAVNELVRRLRTESLHPQLGEDEDILESGIWTISVSYWNANRERVEDIGLGDLIKNRSNETKVKLEGVEQRIDEEVNELENKTGIVS